MRNNLKEFKQKNNAAVKDRTQKQITDIKKRCSECNRSSSCCLIRDCLERGIQSDIAETWGDDFARELKKSDDLYLHRTTHLLNGDCMPKSFEMVQNLLASALSALLPWCWPASSFSGKLARGIGFPVVFWLLADSIAKLFQLAIVPLNVQDNLVEEVVTGLRDCLVTVLLKVEDLSVWTASGLFAWSRNLVFICAFAIGNSWSILLRACQ